MYLDAGRGGVLRCAGMSNDHVSVDMVSPSGKERRVHESAVRIYEERGWKLKLRGRSRKPRADVPVEDTATDEGSD